MPLRISQSAIRPPVASTRPAMTTLPSASMRKLPLSTVKVPPAWMRKSLPDCRCRNRPPLSTMPRGVMSMPERTVYFSPGSLDRTHSPSLRAYCFEAVKSSHWKAPAWLQVKAARSPQVRGPACSIQTSPSWTALPASAAGSVICT